MNQDATAQRAPTASAMGKIPPFDSWNCCEICVEIGSTIFELFCTDVKIDW